MNIERAVTFGLAFFMTVFLLSMLAVIFGPRVPPTDTGKCAPAKPAVHRVVV